MPLTIDKLRSDLEALPTEQRAELALFLIHSLDDQEEGPGVEEAWRIELDRRWEEIESGKVTGVPSEVVFAKLREKYG